MLLQSAKRSAAALHILTLLANTDVFGFTISGNRLVEWLKWPWDIGSLVVRHWEWDWELENWPYEKELYSIFQDVRSLNSDTASYSSNLNFQNHHLRYGRFNSHDRSWLNENNKIVLFSWHAIHSHYWRKEHPFSFLFFPFICFQIIVNQKQEQWLVGRKGNYWIEWVVMGHDGQKWDKSK